MSKGKLTIVEIRGEAAFDAFTYSRELGWYSTFTPGPESARDFAQVVCPSRAAASRFKVLWRNASAREE